MRLAPWLPSLLLTGLLSSCQALDSGYNLKRGTCNQLRSQLIFDGATGDTRQAEIQNSERDLQQHSYDVNNCDQCAYRP